MKITKLNNLNKNKIFVYVSIGFILWITYVIYLYYRQYTNENNKQLIIIETFDNLNTGNTLTNESNINSNVEVNMNINKEPEPSESKTIHKKSGETVELTNQLNVVSADHSNVTDFNKESSQYVKRWPCSMNVTGTFTECGPYAYNSNSCGLCDNK